MTDTFERLKTAVADRYTIEREIGAGGMATVYLARDLKHERQVAIKVLRPELAASLGPDRFLQEIRIAANLHHPHIMPLFDSGRAVGRTGGQAEGSSGEFLFYVMPYVTGESLREKLAKEGELPVSDAVRILKEVVDALAKAHSEGVVHRDIKPDNVMLADRHALVTDFGVAKAVSEATGHHKLTTEGIALGTPAYMAPEQAAADPLIDHRADVYAVGVLAYELLTGRPPFTGTTQQEILAAHVTQAADPVTKYRENVPPVLAQLVMKCLEKKPADRWQTAGELIPQLESLPTLSGAATHSGPLPTNADARSKMMVIGGSALAVILAVTLVVILLPRGNSAVADARRVAVIPFTNITGEDSLDVFGQVVASWITDGLQQVDVLSVVPWMAVQQEANALEGGNPVRELADMTGAGIVISGSYSRHGDSLRFRSEITDPIRLEVLHTIQPVSGLAVNPVGAFEELAERIAGALALSMDVELGDLAALSVHQPTFASYKEAVIGLDMFSLNRFDEASEHLTAAYELDTTSVGNLVMAALAHRNRGRYTTVDSLTMILDESRGLLSSVESQMLEWLLAYHRGNLHEASRLSIELAQQSPGMRYQSALDLLRVNRPQQSREVSEGIDPTVGWIKNWISYWAVLTQASHMLGDHDRELRDARRGREQHPDRLSAFRYEARALAALGRVNEASVLFEELLDLPPHPSWGHAYPVVRAAYCFRAHGYADAAHEAFQLALERLRTHTPNEANRIAYRYNLAQTFCWDEQWDEARDEFLQLATENPDNVNYTGFLGVISVRLGNDDEVSGISDGLAALDRPYLWGSNTLWRARIAALLGDREQAVELLRQSFNEGNSLRLDLHRDIDFESLREYPPFQELMRPKG